MDPKGRRAEPGASAEIKDQKDKQMDECVRTYTHIHTRMCTHMYTHTHTISPSLLLSLFSLLPSLP